MSYSTQQIRNVALAGHPGAGKTTLFEALLQAGGALQAAGSIERGSTVSDFDPIERERGHSIDAAIASTDHATAGKELVHVNLIDTPGYPDFRGPALSALAATLPLPPPILLPSTAPAMPPTTVATVRPVLLPPLAGW